MLAKQDFINWFVINGIDINVPFPLLLISRLCRKSIAFDNNLFLFLNKSFRPYNMNSVILDFKNWNDAFTCYISRNSSLKD